MKKSYESSVDVFDNLPEEIKKEAISIFGAYSELSVEREYGQWKVLTCSCLSSRYAHDHKVYFFSKEEIKKNHKEEIEKEEERFYEESKNCNWELLNN